MAKLTMKEIARRAKVSQPTVSRVINGHKGVSAEIVNAVMRVIEEAGYVPNKAAQTLKRSSAHIIGISVKEIYNPYFVEIIDSLELEARKHGYSVLFHNSKFNPVTEWENIQNFVSRQVDGMIIVPTGDFNLERISKLDIPAVVITQSPAMLDSVAVNHIQAGKLAGESFVHAGHKTFGYIGEEQSGEKFYGFETVLQENGFAFDSRHFIQVHDTSSNSFMIRRDIEQYLDQAGRPEFTCLFAGNDVMALEFIRVAPGAADPHSRGSQRHWLRRYLPVQGHGDLQHPPADQRHGQDHLGGAAQPDGSGGPYQPCGYSHAAHTD